MNNVKKGPFFFVFSCFSFLSLFLFLCVCVCVFILKFEFESEEWSIHTVIVFVSFLSLLSSQDD